MKPPFPNHRQLAKAIAHELLTVTGPRGRKIEATRLQLMLKRPDGSEANMGGHCKQSVIDVIADTLDSLIPDPGKKPRLPTKRRSVTRRQ